MPQSTTPPTSDKENVGSKKKKKQQNTATEKSSKRGTTGRSAQSGSGGGKAAAKRTKQSDKALAEPNANKVTKRTGGVGAHAKRPYEKKTYQKVARVTRSSTKLTGQLSPDSKPYLSCKSSTLSAVACA